MNFSQSAENSGDNGYYSAEFQLSGSKWAYVTGLTQYEAQDIENNIYNGTYQFYVGTFLDAEKNNTDDSQLCWAATASNMLSYTDWGDTVSTDEDGVFDYFKDNFTNDGGRAEFGIEWFMNGTYLPQEWGDGWAQYNGTGGNLYPDNPYNDYAGIIFSDSYYSANARSPLYEVDQYIRNGCGIGIGLGWYMNFGNSATVTESPDGELLRNSGHAITMWGFIYDDTKIVGTTDYYVSLLVSDSDDDYGLGRDAENRLQTYDIAWRETEKEYEFVSYGRSIGYFGIIEDFAYLSKTIIVKTPDLIPYKPSDWSDSLIVTNTEEETTSLSSIDPNDHLYFTGAWTDFNSSGDIADFEVKFTLTYNAPTTPQTKTFTCSELTSGYYYYGTWDYGTLAEGTYTLKMEFDSAGVITDTNEDNNTKEITFTVVGYAAEDCASLKAFLEQTDSSGVKNGTKINSNYNVNDPHTWYGVTWTAVNGTYRVTEIYWYEKDLVGNLDLSGCTALEYLIVIPIS